MKYVAFFRGINVGGKNKVKMADLRSLFIDCGFNFVKTYIQSGNVLLESDLDEAVLSDMISRSFSGRFGFQSPVILRTDHEFFEMLTKLPFSEDELAQAESASPGVAHVYVFLSKDRVDPVAVEALLSSYAGSDILSAGKREFYLFCRKSIRDSKLAAALSKPEAGLTARNLNTLQRISEMLHSE